MVNFWSLALDLFADSDLLVDVRSESADWTVSRLFSTCCGGQWRLHTALWSLLISPINHIRGDLLVALVLAFVVASRWAVPAQSLLLFVRSTSHRSQCRSAPINGRICAYWVEILRTTFFETPQLTKLKRIHLITKTVYLPRRENLGPTLSQYSSSTPMPQVGRALLSISTWIKILKNPRSIFQG